MNLIRETPVIKKNMAKLDDVDKQLTKRKHYSLEDIINNIDTINMGRAILNRAKTSGLIDKEMFLNPYSYMIILDEDTISLFRIDGTVKHYSNKKSDMRYIHGTKPDRLIVQKVASTVKRFVNEEYDLFSNVLPGLTRVNMYSAIMDYKRKCIHKAEGRYLSSATDSVFGLGTGFGTTKDRLYPLSIERYNKFARDKYRELKSPRFKKRFIDSIRFGSSRILSRLVSCNPRGSNGTFHFKKLSVVERHLGLVQIIDSDKHSKLGFELDGGCYVLCKRNNGKRQHLWALHNYRVDGAPSINCSYRGRSIGKKSRSIKSNTYYGYGKEEMLKGIQNVLNELKVEIIDD